METRPDKSGFATIAKMNNQKKAYIYAFIAVLLWSTSASAFKICLDADRLNMPVLSLLFGASLTSCAALLICLLLSRKLGLLKALSRRDLLHSAVLGFLNPFLYYTVLFKAYSLLPAQQAQPLNFVWPLVLVLLSAPMLKQRIKRRDIAAMLISFLGVLVISTQGRPLSFNLTDPLGTALATGSSIPWALFWIYNAKDKKDPVVRMFLSFAFASGYTFLLVLLLGRLKMPTLYPALGATYVGLIEMGITFLIWLKALKLSKTTAHVANFIYLVPFGALVVIHLVIGEQILPSTIIGAVLIVAGIILQKFPTPR
ncbi:MAG TPA: DMT family transporter [Sedimentisphaerales bacterium]|nr:DMT family transporter [Sedimentisphaerales bacterium]